MSVRAGPSKASQPRWLDRKREATQRLYGLVKERQSLLAGQHAEIGPMRAVMERLGKIDGHLTHQTRQKRFS